MKIKFIGGPQDGREMDTERPHPFYEFFSEIEEFPVFIVAPPRVKDIKIPETYMYFRVAPDVYQFMR